MAENISHERRNLAYFWSIITALFLAYILVKHGDKLEILTLIIGLIGGTILGGVFGVYFSGTAEKKPATGAPGTATMEINATATTESTTPVSPTADDNPA